MVGSTAGWKWGFGDSENCHFRLVFISEEESWGLYDYDGAFRNFTSQLPLLAIVSGILYCVAISTERKAFGT